MNRCRNLYEHLGISLFDSDYLEPGKNNDVKKHLGEQHVLYMLNRTQVMFDYKKLPETIPARNLEMMLQLNGNIFFTKVYGDFYVFTGGLGGEPDVYYEPTIYTVANPYLNYSKNLVIGDDGILIRNDSYGVGLLPLFKKYAALLAENELTMRIADVNNRIMFLLSAADDRTKASAEKFMDDVSKGKLDVISDNAFLESLKVLPAATQNSVRLTDLIEFEQYLRAGWFNDLGINANYNMKRESISPNEAQLNDDALLPFVDDMLEMRRIGIKQVNEKYELDIEVNLSSSWLKEQMEQVTPGVDFDSDNDEHINEDVSDTTETADPETAAPVPDEIPEEVPEDTTKEEPETKETEDNQIEEDIREIKEDIQDIKEELQDPEDKPEEDPEEGEKDE